MLPHFDSRSRMGLYMILLLRSTFLIVSDCIRSTQPAKWKGISPTTNKQFQHNFSAAIRGSRPWLPGPRDTCHRDRQILGLPQSPLWRVTQPLQIYVSHLWARLAGSAGVTDGHRSTSRCKTNGTKLAPRPKNEQILAFFFRTLCVIHVH